MEQTTLTLKFRGLEADILKSMVESGMFNSKSEAIRSAIIHYAMEAGLFESRRVWAEIQKFPRRKATAQQLAKDLLEIEHEV